MSGRRIRFFLKLLVNITNRKNQITLSDASKLFDLDEECLIDYVRVLADHGILSMEYSADGGKVLKKGPSVKDVISQKELNEKVDAVLNEVNVEEMEKTKGRRFKLDRPA